MSVEQQPSIDQKLVLSDLLDADLLRDITLKFSVFAGLRIRLTDERGSIFLAQGEIPRYCSFVRSTEQGRKFCDEASAEAAWVPMEAGHPIVHSCFCGLKYVVSVLATDFDIVGRALLGPFRTIDSKVPQKVLDLGATKTQVEYALEKFAIRDVEDTRRIASFFTDVMDIFLFLSAKRLLTSRVHLETIFRAREEIFRDMENQMSSKEDREELEKLKRIF